MHADPLTIPVRIPAGARTMLASLRLPDAPRGLAVFVHASGSARLRGSQQLIPRYLEGRGYATLFVDLLTMGEEANDVRSGCYRLDMGFLSDRICLTLLWIRRQPELRALPVGLIGVHNAGGAAMVSAAAHPDRVRAVVSISGRPDLADAALDDVRIPALLITGAHDTHGVDLNRQALAHLHSEHRLDIIDGTCATLDEGGAPARAAADTADWLDRYVAQTAPLTVGAA